MTLHRNYKLALADAHKQSISDLWPAGADSVIGGEKEIGCGGFFEIDDLGLPGCP